MTLTKVILNNMQMLERKPGEEEVLLPEAGEEEA
jgi:hypothetical protein